jgi:CheY-like chemotaxis protein
MEVESKVDVGTTFSLIFPVLHEAPLAGTSRSVAALPRGRGRVLVLDDEELLGNLVLRLLADEHEVTIVSEEPEAMQRLQAAMPFDAIICSVTMHGAEGAPSYEAIIASQPALAERLVLVAGSMFTSSAAGFQGEGGHGRVVPSYFSAGELREVVGRLVQRAQSSDGDSRARQGRS